MATDDGIKPAYCHRRPLLLLSQNHHRWADICPRQSSSLAVIFLTPCFHGLKPPQKITTIRQKLTLACRKPLPLAGKHDVNRDRRTEMR